MTNFSLGGNTSEARIVRRGGGSNALGFFIFVFFFVVSGQGDFSDTGGIHGRKWPPDTNTEVQASSAEDAL